MRACFLVLTDPDLSPLGVLCRDLALRMTERPSVTGTPDEASFGPWLAELLAVIGQFGAEPEIWTLPVAPGDARHCVAMLVRGTGPATVLLTGHYDTVTMADYGDMAAVATEPQLLTAALLSRTDGAAEGTAEARTHADLASGLYVPGRGLLDMKGGLAAGLAAMAAWAERPGQAGNLLFLAVPDEENASAGARAAARELGPMLDARGLELRAAINLDSIADDGDGTAGRVVALGTVGKVLPTAYVVGAPVHSGFPLRGLNAAVLGGAIAMRLEWAPELTDETADEPGTPISLLSLKDGKTGYDVTTPGTAFLTWSVLNHRRDPSAVLPLVEALVRDAVDGCLSDLRARAGRSGQAPGLIAQAPEIPVLRYGALLDQVREAIPAIEEELEAEALRLRSLGANLPDVAQALTTLLWARSGLSGPAVVLGLGSIPYLATELSDARVREAVEALAAEAPARHGAALRVVEFFAGISDMSFFGQGDAGAFARLARDTPSWGSVVGLDDRSLAQVPTVNLGPWGRDYHTPYERIETRYGFEVLPRLVLDLAQRILA